MVSERQPRAIIANTASLMIQLLEYKDVPWLLVQTSRHVNDTADTIPSLDHYLEQGRRHSTHATYMHIVEPFVDLFKLALMSNIFVDLERAFEIV